MKTLRWILVAAAAVGVAALLATQAVPAAEEPGADARLGEKLVRDLWAALKAGDVEALDTMIAPGFQSVHQDGARTRAQELALVEHLNMGEYSLSGFKITPQRPGHRRYLPQLRARDHRRQGVVENA